MDFELQCVLNGGSVPEENTQKQSDFASASISKL